MANFIEMRRLAILLLTCAISGSAIHGQGSDTTMYYETNWSRVMDGAGKRVYWKHQRPTLYLIIGTDSTRIAPRFWTRDFLCWAFNQKEIDSAISVAIRERVPPRRLVPFPNFSPAGCIRSIDSAIALSKEAPDSSEVRVADCN